MVGDLEKYRNAYCVSNCLPGHSIRTALIAICLAKELDIETSEVYHIGLGGILHDIGKLLIPSKIIDKPCKLSVTEFKVIKEHPSIGFEMLKNQKWLPKDSLKIVQNHHEKIDGSGYPNQLSGIQIPFYGCLVGVADVFDAVTSKRNYRDALSYRDALCIIQKETPNLLDENLVMVLGDTIEKYYHSNTTYTKKLNIQEYNKLVI
ncbi:HD domain-containing protein [Acetobacterium paludosum]|uniref:HD domain-containing protein n=1 Tax=Acetobacterium paludosum TaxID=52693 RepID=A0A923I1E8_9FIRM|nr:HD domain-containing phosphohydrolase [Acetobacterium paludosum]MBC3889931.1 HD domain-containing protein [Acetobacterium paludosum]